MRDYKHPHLEAIALVAAFLGFIFIVGVCFYYRDRQNTLRSKSSENSGERDS